MGDSQIDDAGGAVMVDVYRHDAHKLRGQSHANASQRYAGVPVNRPVPAGADGDAAALSRPTGKPTQTVENHERQYRLSLISTDSQYDAQRVTRHSVENAVPDLLVEDDAEALHRVWVKSRVAAVFNESVYYPYTSLKYHTLLVAALLDTYRDGCEFSDLHLVVDDAGTLIPHRTVYAGERFTLRIDEDVDDRPSARLGSHPWQSWAAVWTRLPAHPLDTDHETYDMVLDANLRRITSWSTALQYIEDFEEAFER